MFKLKQIFLLTPLVFLSACGGGSSSSSGDNEIELPPPTFSLAVSDAPVDDLSEVIVCFNQIELKGSGTNTIFTVGNENGMITANDLCLNNNGSVIPDTVGIDLRSYTGSNSVALVEGITIEAGSYTQLRLIMSDGSYGIDKESGEKISVSVPSNELKLDGFTATLGSTVDFTLEFDLNQAMTNPVGKAGYFLKPRGLRLVNNNEAGHIEGTVSETFLINNQCAPLADASVAIASIYLYKGTDLALDSLSDNGGSEESQPLTSESVNFDNDIVKYSFEIGFISAGGYTLAVSCDTEDNPEADDLVSFISSQNVNVVAGNQAIQVNFDAL